MRSSHLQTYHFKIVWAAVVVKGAQIVAEAAEWRNSAAEPIAGSNSGGAAEAKLDGIWAAVVVKGAQVVAKAPGWSLATTESLAGRSSWRDEDAKRTRL